MLHDVVPMVEIESEIERLSAVKRLGQSRSAWCFLRQEALWVASQETVTAELRIRWTMYRKEFSVVTRDKAELTNQRRGSGSKSKVYYSVPHGGAECCRYSGCCRLPLLFSNRGEITRNKKSIRITYKV